MPPRTDLPDRPWPFVGRDDTVKRIVSGVANSAAGAFLLHGVSGIGKSRTATEAAARLAQSGWNVIRIQGNAGLTRSPLAAMSPVFAGDPAELTAIIEDPLGLLAAANSRITELAAGRRTMLLVDDISLVDPLSLTVLVQLLQARTVKVVATARSGEPLPDALVALWTGDRVTRIDLPALGFTEVHQLLREYLGSQIAMHAVASLLEASGGNPLYLRELVLGTLGEGRLVSRDGSWQLVGELTGTPALHELIEARLAGLDPVARDVAERLALCGTLLPDELIGEGARAALADLEANGFVAVTDSPRGLTVSLSHPQYVSVLRASIPRLRASDLLLEQATLVEARAGASATPAPQDAVRIATWRLDAGRPANPELLLTGARLARLANDYADALRLAEAAVTAGAGDSATQVLIGEALRTLGRNDAALVALERAEQLAIAAGDDDARIHAVTLHALALSDTPAGSSAGLAELDALTTAVPAAADAIRTVRAVLLMNEDRAADAVELLAGQEPSLQADIAGCVPLAAVGRGSEALAASERVLAHVETTPPQQAQLTRRMALFLRATVLLMTGSPVDAAAVATASLQDAIESADELGTRRAEFTLGHANVEVGSLRTAARWFRDVASGALAHGPISYRGAALGALAHVQLWRGQLDEARATLAEVPADALDEVSTASALGWLAALDGDAAAGRALLVERAAHYRAVGHAFHEAWMLFNAARIGAAAEVAGRLRELADAGDSALADARAGHAEALADGGAAPLEAAALRWRELGYAFLSAELLAAASRAAGSAGDARRAAQLAREAAERTEALQGADIPGLRTTAGAEVLTPREREIAQLAAAGSSSQAIADQLFLSIRTVDNHLQSAYRKLGVAGRAELADAL
jgi:DNA-binding CsgD family transcriptional regulator